MTDELRAFLNEQTREIDDMVREAIELCDGSSLRALYATIIANKFLSEDNERLREENESLKSQAPKGFARSARSR